jgi:hypothetical protein
MRRRNSVDLGPLWAASRLYLLTVSVSRASLVGLVVPLKKKTMLMIERKRTGSPALISLYMSFDVLVLARTLAPPLVETASFLLLATLSSRPPELLQSLMWSTVSCL